MQTTNLPNGFFNNDMTVFINVELPKSNAGRKTVVDENFRRCFNKPFHIFVDNHQAQSHNVNIDNPFYFCFALTQKEAIEKMMKSDFEHKHKKITCIK